MTAVNPDACGTIEEAARRQGFYLTAADLADIIYMADGDTSAEGVLRAVGRVFPDIRTDVLVAALEDAVGGRPS